MAAKKVSQDVIRLSAEGEWFQGGEEITHARTVDLFFKSITRRDGKFMLTGDKTPVPVVVEDTAYFVRAIARADDDWNLRLSDGTTESLNPETLDVGAENQLYCRVKEGQYRARFDRKVYYEVTRSLGKRDGFYGLRRGEMFYPLGRERPEADIQPPSATQPSSRKPKSHGDEKTGLPKTRHNLPAKAVKKPTSQRSAKKNANVRSKSSAKKNRRKERR